jgi:hypothetical protein
MPHGPKIKLAIDLHRIDRFFPLEKNLRESFDYNMVIDRPRYEEVNELLKEYSVTDDQIIREICFILLWMEKELQSGSGNDNNSGKFHQMWLELDGLKDYLLKNRITSISFQGESARNKPNEELIISEDINIDRICDGIRSVFREEFHHDKLRRRTKGLTTWQRRKMIKIRNNILNYFTMVPSLDELSLEEQNELVTELSGLAGISIIDK